MLKQFMHSITKSKKLVIGTVIGLSIMSAGSATMLTPQAASAASCDSVNIVYCGIDGSNLNSSINSFQADYNGGSNNGHNDLKAVYRWAGATDASVSNMNTSNTKLGTLYRNGDIKVDGKVVGHDAWVTARFNSGAGFQEISPGVWARKTTTSFAEASAQVLVHFNNNDQADFAVMTGCGNAIKFPPVTPPAPKPELKCENLKASEVGNTRKYVFAAKADAKHVKIVKYTFHFGDGSQDVVRTDNDQAGTTHTYDKDGKSYDARVVVTSADGQEDSGPNCKVTIKTPEAKPMLVCTSLSQQQVIAKKLTYKFVAKADAEHTTIKKYVFTYSDGTSETVKTNARTASTTHTFPLNDTTYVTSVAVSSDDKKDVTSNDCKVSLTTPKVNECKPGVPVGSPECTTPVPPTTPPTTMTTVSSTTELPKTGAGSVVALFALVTIAGTVFHRLYSRYTSNQLI